MREEKMKIEVSHLKDWERSKAIKDKLANKTGNEEAL